MAITTVSFLDILDSNLVAPKPYLDFRTRYVAFIFRKPENVTVLGINGYSVTDANFTLLPNNAIIADPNDANRNILNWSKLNILWQIPTGIIPYLGKFTYNSEQFYVIFGILTADGGFDATIGCGKEVTVIIDPGITNPVEFTEVRLESYPYRQPCDIVKTYYNTTGIISITLT